jgi:NAD(P)H dehydrogenase (quinone)
MNIGITGATGQLGRIVVQRLLSKTSSDHIVALARSPKKAADLGVEAREFDYTKPELLATALKGIDTLLLISGNQVGQRAVQHANVIKAAKAARIRWVVYTSLLRADTSSLSLAAEHLETEKNIQASDIPFTILRNGWYTENYTGSIPGALAGGALIGSAGDGKISSAARADYAEAAVTVLTGKDHQGKIYELAGDDFYTLTEFAAEISRQTGKTIPYKNLSEHEYASVLQTFGLPEGLAKAIAGWDVGASKGDLFDAGHLLSRLIGRPTTSFVRVISSALATSK